MNRDHFNPSSSHFVIGALIAALVAAIITFGVFSAMVAIGAPDQVRLAAAVKSRHQAATSVVVASSDTTPRGR